ncbi:MAG: hypothetical protein JXQ66_03830, partial [Campylobacterales bacterium]|nr:hypothetical protein [Campylobacterales bacterium]
MKMDKTYKIKDISISINDFVQSDCISIINNIDEDSYSSYCTYLYTIAKEKMEEDDILSGNILRLISEVCYMALKPQSNNEPFSPMVVWHDNTRSKIVDDFSDDEIDFFNDILKFIDDYRIKSRLADILWLISKPRNPKHLEMAIENYQLFSLKYDDILDDSKECWERAIRLSLMTRKSLDNIHAKLLDELEITKVEDGNHLFWIQELLFISKVDKSKYGHILQRLDDFAVEFKNKSDFNRSKDYLESCKNWTDNIDEINKYTIKTAEVYELQAEAS